MPVAIALALRVLALFVVTVAVGSVLFNALAYHRAALYRRRHPPACPFADDDPPAPGPARALRWVRAFGGECAAAALLTASVPLALRRPRVHPIALDGRRPVIFVHGYAQHAANFVCLARRLRRDGWPHLYSVNHLSAVSTIERNASRLDGWIDRVLDESGATEIDLVAHSMGGLVARACIAARAGRGVARLITLGTPHQGTEAFRWLARDPAEMRAGSPLLHRLAARDDVPSLVDCTSIYSAHDALVVPPGNAYYPGAFNIEVQALGHMSLLFSRRVYELVRENLVAEAALPRERDRTRAGG
jgi:pimeloyl-ACP methyl ester carboxylesterase